MGTCNQIMATCATKTECLQQSASIGIPGQWIDDETVDVRTSKIGGNAKYFYLRHKTKELIHCLSCKKKMYLLAQINAPLMEAKIQRNIYLFMCCNSKCSKSSKGWKCFVHRGPNFDDLSFSKRQFENDENEKRVHDIQKLIKQNNKTKNKTFEENESFWNKDLNENDDDTKENKLKIKMNGLNDDFSRLMAMQSKLLNEVEKQQSSQQKKSKKIKKSKTQIHKKSVVKKGCFVPFEISFYNEGYYKNDDVIKWKDKEIDLNDYVKESNDEKDEDTDDAEVDLLSDYMLRMSYDRTQCLRYCYGDSPLVPHKVLLDKVPECKHCGNKKVFEFQVMSPILNYLEPKQIHHDWLTVLVFVCPMTCTQSDEQHVIVCCE